MRGPVVRVRGPDGRTIAEGDGWGLIVARSRAIAVDRVHVWPATGRPGLARVEWVDGSRCTFGARCFERLRRFVFNAPEFRGRIVEYEANGSR